MLMIKLIAKQVMSLEYFRGNPTGRMPCNKQQSKRKDTHQTLPTKDGGANATEEAGMEAVSGLTKLWNL